MPYYPLEGFCRAEYPGELTYDELIAYEAELIQHLEQTLAAFGAVHVDVFPDGDELRVQCAFAEMSDVDFDAMAHELAAAFVKCTDARVLLLHKNLQYARVARFLDGRARMQNLQIA